MKVAELRKIIKEEVSNISLTQSEISQLVDKLIGIGYKKYQIDIDRAYGVYFITLPQNSLSISDMIKFSKILPEGSLIGIYKDVFSGLSIKTSIKV